MVTYGQRTPKAATGISGAAQGFLQSTSCPSAPQRAALKDAGTIIVGVGRAEGRSQTPGTLNSSRASFLLGGIFIENALFP